MTGWVTGSGRGHQGIYECATVDWTAPTTNSYVAQLNVDVAANASGNPRLDLVVLEVLDLQHVGTGSSVQQIRVITGTPTAAATLDNRNGAPALPATCILLADILVANGAVSIATADIRDRRMFPLWTVPPLTTDVDQVGFVCPHTEIGQQNISNNSHDLAQAAVLVYLPRRIVNATRIRWKYRQDAVTANTGNYNLGVYDASGRQIVATGAVAFAGAINTYQVRSEAITATTFEAGCYYLFAGWDTATAGGASNFRGVFTAIQAGVAGVSGPNVMYSGGATTGTTLPTTLNAMTDVNTRTADAGGAPVPIFALSVG
jgi:hypothetical protein